MGKAVNSKHSEKPEEIQIEGFHIPKTTDVQKHTTFSRVRKNKPVWLGRRTKTGPDYTRRLGQITEGLIMQAKKNQLYRKTKNMGLTQNLTQGQ